MCNQGADANDRMIDMLWELVAKRSSDFVVTLPDELVGSREPGQVRHGLQVPNDDTVGHGNKRPISIRPSPHWQPIRFPEATIGSLDPLPWRSPLSPSPAIDHQSAPAQIMEPTMSRELNRLRA